MGGYVELFSAVSLLSVLASFALYFPIALAAIFEGWSTEFVFKCWLAVSFIASAIMMAASFLSSGEIMWWMIGPFVATVIILVLAVVILFVIERMRNAAS